MVTNASAVMIPIAAQPVSGFQVGGGIESAITDRWLARFAYRYSAARALEPIIVSANGVTGGTFQAYPRWHYGEIALVYSGRRRSRAARQGRQRLLLAKTKRARRSGAPVGFCR